MEVVRVFKLSITMFAVVDWGNLASLVLLLLALLPVQFHVASQRVPLPGPNLRQCRHDSPCCLKVPEAGVEPVEFVPNSSIPVRTRLSVNTAMQSPAYLKKLATAYRKMKDLQRTDPKDPRGMEQQRRVHCVYCSSGLAYGPDYQVHSTWFFFPWHRMYLYFHERILASLLGDPEFRLLFWNWDSKAGRPFPEMFQPRSSPLFHLKRNHSPLSLRATVRNATTKAMLRSAVIEAETHELFLGRPLGTGQGGLFEIGIHNAIHNAVGQQTPPFRDMGNFLWASADPVFFAHHANIDRAWWVWQQLPTSTTARRRTNPTDPAWRESRFVFYDENNVLTSIRVRDVVDFERNLRYDYEIVNNDWLPRRRENILSRWGKDSLASSWLIPLRSVGSVRTTGGPVDCPLVARAGGADSALAAAANEGMLVATLKSFHLTCQSPFAFHVYLLGTDRDRDGKKSTSRLHYVSSFYSFSTSGSRSGWTRTIQFPIRHVVGSDLELGGKMNWTVRIVPQELGARPTGNVSLTLPSVSIEWLLPTNTTQREQPPRIAEPAAESAAEAGAGALSTARERSMLPFPGRR